ncbi:MAG: class I SAM-dependent methyltransferase [Bauldia sp.]
MDNGWDASAPDWIAHLGEEGDFGRRYVLDQPMLARVRGRGFRNALDVGCGEGRFCRMLAAEGIAATGIDPTSALLAAAQAHDPRGDYREGVAETLAFPDGAFDLVVSYLTLIDIDGVRAAIPEMARVLRPGGALLIANLTNFNTSSLPEGWRMDPDGNEVFVVDRYFDERSEWTAWRGIRIRNWHRPLSVYMSLLVDAGLVLRHFAEPEPTIGGPRAERYRRAPWFMMMEWTKPA